MNWTFIDLDTNSTTFPKLTDHVEIYLLAFNFLFGLLTHPYITWLIITGSKSKIASEFFTLNLSVCDTGNCLNSLLFILSQVVFSRLYTIASFLQGLATTGHPLFQCVICVERYLAVVHPVIFLKSKPLRYRLICSTAPWLITLCACFFCWFTIMPANLRAYILFFFMQFFLFFFIQLFCLVSVLRALKLSGPGDRKREEENHTKRRAFQLILINTVNVAVMYVPYIIASLYSMLTLSNSIVQWNYALFCFVLASFVQPVLYLQRAGRLPCSS